MQPTTSFSRAFLATAFAGALFTFGPTAGLNAQNSKSAAPVVDPASHAAHVAAGTMPATTAPPVTPADPALTQQLLQLQTKLAQLEATLAKSAPPMAAPPGGGAMPGMPDAAPAANPAMGMDKMKPAEAMPGMSATPAPAGGAMGMMDKMMGMMDKMMSMGGMAKDKMGSGAMPAAAPMRGGMGMDKLMGMSPMASVTPGATPQSSLPGFPAASHLYHIGATGFFLDLPPQITLVAEQQAGLTKIKEQALLSKSNADRALETAEQALWTLTASDQPDATKIDAKIREIEKMRGDERLAFIRAVGDASKLLTDEQRKSLTISLPPVPTSDAMPMPPAAPATPAMTPMTDM